MLFPDEQEKTAAVMDEICDLDYPNLADLKTDMTAYLMSSCKSQLEGLPEHLVPKGFMEEVVAYFHSKTGDEKYRILRFMNNSLVRVFLIAVNSDGRAVSTEVAMEDCKAMFKVVFALRDSDRVNHKSISLHSIHFLLQACSNDLQKVMDNIQSEHMYCYENLFVNVKAKLEEREKECGKSLKSITVAANNHLEQDHFMAGGLTEEDLAELAIQTFEEYYRTACIISGCWGPFEQAMYVRMTAFVLGLRYSSSLGDLEAWQDVRRRLANIRNFAVIDAKITMPYIGHDDTKPRALRVMKDYIQFGVPPEASTSEETHPDPAPTPALEESEMPELESVGCEPVEDPVSVTYDSEVETVN